MNKNPLKSYTQVEIEQELIRYTSKETRGAFRLTLEHFNLNLEKNLTRDRIAKIMGMSYSTLNNYSIGVTKMNIKTLNKLNKAVPGFANVFIDKLKDFTPKLDKDGFDDLEVLAAEQSQLLMAMVPKMNREISDLKDQIKDLSDLKARVAALEKAKTNGK